MDDKDWFWHDDSYKLDAESPLAISRSLWDGLAQSEADSRSLFSTPTGDILDSDLHACTLNRKDDGASKNVHAADSSRDGSPRAKRRRMLLFPGSATDSPFPDRPFDSFLDSSYASDSTPIMPGCEDYGKFDAASPNSLWYLQNEEPQFSLDEVLDPSSPKWMTGSFGDCPAHETYDPTKLIEADAEPSGSHPDYGQQPQQPQSCEPIARDCQSPSLAMSPTAGRRPSAEFPRPKSVTPVAYPFALLKPCGAQGDVTLSDINQRISMPPPSRHSPSDAGDDARPSPSQPSVLSPGGSPGLSGKSVVALTKIHTEGNGTITIMRTRG